jgi:methionyl-tRNA formyltransferase
MDINYAFFGTGPLAESVLASLVRAGFVPSLVVTKPDAPQGRHMQLTAPHIKTWAEMNHISTFQPESLKELPDDSPLHSEDYDIFIVASYGKIIPETILNLPKKGVLNVHPSLLPKYRGPSPIESALLEGDLTTGVSIMKLDTGMDTGPILVQSAFIVDPTATAGTLEVECGQLGGELLVQVLPSYLNGTLIPKEQEGKEIICKKITKELGEITLQTNGAEVQKKFRALTPWPSIYFFFDHKGKNMRVKVTGVDLLLAGSETLTAKDVITKVVPEGKSEMSFEDFSRGYLN